MVGNSFGMVSGVGRGMGVFDGGGDRRRERGSFGGNCRSSHCNLTERLSAALRQSVESKQIIFRQKEECTNRYKLFFSECWPSRCCVRYTLMEERELGYSFDDELTGNTSEKIPRCQVSNCRLLHVCCFTLTSLL